MIAKLFYSHILNMNRGSLHTISFRRIYRAQRFPSLIHEVSGVYNSPFVDADELKMALQARKVSKAFEKRPQPGPNALCISVRHFHSALHPSVC